MYGPFFGPKTSVAYMEDSLVKIFLCMQPSHLGPGSLMRESLTLKVYCSHNCVYYQ